MYVNFPLFTNKIIQFILFQSSILSFAVYHISKRVRDYALLLTGMLLDTFALISYMIFYSHAKPRNGYDTVQKILIKTIDFLSDDWSTFPLFIFAMAVDLTGAPIAADGGGSLFSKVTSIENQGIKIRDYDFKLG